MVGNGHQHHHCAGNVLGDLFHPSGSQDGVYDDPTPAGFRFYNLRGSILTVVSKTLGRHMENQFNPPKRLIFGAAFSDDDLGLRKQDIFLATTVGIGLIGLGAFFLVMLLPS